MARRKHRMPSSIKKLDAFAMLSSGLIVFHDNLKDDGFTLAKTALARPRKDGSWRIRFVWRKRTGDCSTVISRSVIMDVAAYG